VNWVDLGKELKWLRDRGSLRLVQQSSIDVAKRQCRDLGFSIITIDGSRIDSDEAFHREVKEALAFPDYYGMNWNAFNDSIGDFYELNRGKRFCIFVEHFDQILSADLKVALYICHKLLDIDYLSFVKRGNYDPGQAQIEVMFCGIGDAYDKAY
jgi:Barstar (barnase inhibitor)